MRPGPSAGGRRGPYAPAVTSSSDGPSDRGAALRGPLAAALAPHGLAVSDLRRLSGGASRETWAVEATGDDGDRSLILQRLRPGGSVGAPPMEVEDQLLRAAAAGGVPVPPVVVDAPAAQRAGLGPARISERVAGEALGPRIVRARRAPDERRSLARQMGAALAAIHAIDPASVGPLEAVDPLERVRAGLDLLGEARPALELGLRRLAETRPDHGPDTVVHGDFRVGNLLIEDDRLTAVLDWELAHRGDPAEDLGWLCGRAWRFGGDHEVGGVADLDDLLAGYVEAGGRPLTPEAVRWWTAAGTLLWGLICAVQARRHLDGHIRSVELASIGRRVCEAEYDLLDLVLPPTDPADGCETAAATDAPGRREPDASPTAPAATDPGTSTTNPAPERPRPEAPGSGGAGPDRGAATVDPAPDAARGDAPPPPGSGPPPRPDLHGRPTAAELVDAVRGHLADELAPGLEGSAHFHARVAIRALEVIERELLLGPEQALAHERRLSALGVADEVELAARIRAGELDGRPDVDAAVRAAVVDRLRVANPRWLHHPHA